MTKFRKQINRLTMQDIYIYIYVHIPKLTKPVSDAVAI